MNSETNQFIKELIIIFFEKGFLAIAILYAGYIITKSIDRAKSNDAFKNEMTKRRVDRIAKFYDLYSEYEHWVNRLIVHAFHKTTHKKDYLTSHELIEASTRADNISNIIGFELNQMRFWINDDIYFHTVAQLELFKKN